MTDSDRTVARHLRLIILLLAISADGEHFKIFATLEDQPGEYFYPAIIQDRDGNLDATYTWNQKRISFASIPLPRASATHHEQ